MQQGFLPIGADPRKAMHPFLPWSSGLETNPTQEIRLKITAEPASSLLGMLRMVEGMIEHTRVSKSWSVKRPENELSTITLCTLTILKPLVHRAGSIAIPATQSRLGIC
ncbi:hypothetical protein CISG_04090 [Coccidioides immitis RMSCC 3703]|uniref:Uncharacterized protein n=2 Tax=Coccidioides immitis TaxID=5501 RepID=A0A0J8QNX6_COCIT|nr:hypothetical protein CIRG_08687 [Coccidioides immitis RMSCC 2394]KMU74161.1 hypothetical protein CISG_04090 [Coccidioides immitis RMSCC 3703]